MNNWLDVSVRWGARITGLLLVGLVALITVGEGGPPNIMAQPLLVQVEFAAMFTMLAGFLVGWRWEGVGGVTAVVGFLVFLASEMIGNGTLPGGAIPLFVVPGILLLISHGLTCISRKPQDGRLQPMS